MLRKLSVSIMALGTGLVGSSFSRAEDLVIVFNMTGSGGDRTATHYYTANRVRLSHGDEDTIVDFAAGRVLNISNNKKQYSETTFAEMEQAMTSTSVEMEKAMASIPSGLRDKMMGDAAKEVTVTTGDMRTVAGVSCQSHTITLGERTRMETCTTTSIVPPFDPRNFKKLALITVPLGPGNSGLSKLVQRMREIDGFSVASSSSLNLLGRRVETTTEAIEIRRGPIEGTTFDLPQGFKKVDSPFAKMAR